MSKKKNLINSLKIFLSKLLQTSDIEGDDIVEVIENSSTIIDNNNNKFTISSPGTVFSNGDTTGETFVYEEDLESRLKYIVKQIEEKKSDHFFIEFQSKGSYDGSTAIQGTHTLLFGRASITKIPTMKIISCSLYGIIPLYNVRAEFKKFARIELDFGTTNDVFSIRTNKVQLIGE